jgi:hypothetical protein
MYDILFTLSDIVGIMGVCLVLVAYYHLSVGNWDAKKMRFQLMNFTGAWLILFSLCFHWNTASVTIEIAWILVSIVGICRIKGIGFKQES